MKCNTNTMLKTAAALAVVAGLVYFTVPAAQALVLASAPILIALICPISMLFMMKMMNSNSAPVSSPAGEDGKTLQSQETAAATVIEPTRAANPVLLPGSNSPLRQENPAA
jgi:hypothetical protein